MQTYEDLGRAKWSHTQFFMITLCGVKMMIVKHFSSPLPRGLEPRALHRVARGLLRGLWAGEQGCTFSGPLTSCSELVKVWYYLKKKTNTTNLNAQSGKNYLPILSLVIMNHDAKYPIFHLEIFGFKIIVSSL